MSADVMVWVQSILVPLERMATTPSVLGFADWAFAAGWLVLQVALCALVADFFSGVIHWLEDSYFGPKTPLIGKWVIEPNLLHHRDPRAMVKNSWWVTNNVLLLIAAGMIGLTLALGVFTWQVGLTVVLLAHGAEFHRWAHRTRTENGRVIVWLQQNGFVQSPAHHAGHHRHDKDRRYCTITDYVNPALDRVRFWRGLEAVIWALTGVERRGEPEEGEHEHEHEHEKGQETVVAKARTGVVTGVGAGAGASVSLALPQVCGGKRVDGASGCAGRCRGCARRAG